VGSSGIAPIEALFNRGPFPVSGGASVVNATGWNLGESYATTTVPSMRMVVDLADFDASTWNHLTGASGHAFHEHYIDQTADWAVGTQKPWAFSAKAVDAAAVDTLVLTPKG
jgi:penicillin amidase